MDQNVSLPSPATPVRHHLLVVEDVDTTRRRLVDTLRGHGYQVDEAVNGLEALKKVSSTRFDAILLDLVLPHVDGWQFRETQLRHPELARIPTVVVTIRPLREPDRYVLRPSEVVQKPFEDSVLIAAIRKACGTIEQPVAPQPAHDAQLFWSRRGEVACWTHAPLADSGRWHAEGWTLIPDGAGKGRIVYQCQHCPGCDGPVEHRKRQPTYEGQ
jgi:CheY-like chemotaxis protein